MLAHSHNSPTAGHFSFEKTLSKLKDGYIWHGMRTDCEQFTKTCATSSINKKATVRPRAALGAYHAGCPLERVHVDILGPFIPPSDTGNQYVLMIVDQFTKWVECFPMPRQTAEMVARTFVDGFISRMGCPLQVHTDQGRQFEGSLFQAVCDLLEIAKTRTTPYRPCSNGQVERYNRTLLQLIKCYRRGNLQSWDRDLQLLAGAMRATRNRQTGFTANMMMFGREVIKPMDVLLGTALANADKSDPAEYVTHLREALQRIHEEARTVLQATQARQKRDYDLRLHTNSFAAGDLVYEVNSATQVGQSSKLRPVWKGPLLVTEVKSPVLFRIRGRKDSRVVHHDQLKPCNDRDVPGWMARLRHEFIQTLDVEESSTVQRSLPDTEDSIPEGLAVSSNGAEGSIEESLTSDADSGWWGCWGCC